MLPEKVRQFLIAQHKRKMGKKKQFVELTRVFWIHLNPYNCITLWYKEKKVYDETATSFVEEKNREWIDYLVKYMNGRTR